MKYRPWNGVFLSDKYLSSVEAAEGITASVLRLYHRYGVRPLVESNVSSAAELRRLHTLLEDAVCCGQRKCCSRDSNHMQGGSESLM